MSVIIQHKNSGLYLAKATRDVYRRGHANVAKLIGASGSYRWAREQSEAIRFKDDNTADLACTFMRDPPVWFIDVNEPATS